jgi:ketosteroid isomerase-like protein
MKLRQTLPRYGGAIDAACICCKSKLKRGEKALISYRNAKLIISAWLFFATLLIVGSVAAQQQSEIDAVKAANQAFYTAFSARDIAAMQKVWSSDADIQNIGPRYKTFAVGGDTINKRYDDLFNASLELKVSMEPRIKIAEAVAWASGIEQIQRKDKAGATSSGTNLATNIFQKQDGRWLMVHHHASAMPQ